MDATVHDPEDIGKIFVGGLSPQTTKETLYSYFSQFGEVVDSVVMKNNETGRSRGFGFVTYKDPNCVYKALQRRDHELDGKKVDPKECTPRSMQKSRKQVAKCKVFLGGLPADITVEAIQSAMSKFGKVDQVLIMVNPETRKCRGFGFLSFELEESIDQACAQRYVTIDGKQIECKRAEPRSNQRLFAASKGFPRNKDDYVKQSSFGQTVSSTQSNWSMPSQPLNNNQGSSYAQDYPNYNNPAVLNSSPGNYGNLPSVPYAQSYQQNYASPVGNYSYSPVPVATLAQPVFMASSYPAGISVVSNSYGANDYFQSPPSSVPSKTACEVTNTSEAAYHNQSTTSTSYQRFHPYKA